MIGEDVCVIRVVGTVDIVAETVEVTITVDGNVEISIVVDLVDNNEALVFIIVVVIVEDDSGQYSLYGQSPISVVTQA